MSQLKNISCRELAQKMCAIPENTVHYIYGSEDIDDGECYGVLKTTQLGSDLLVICYLGGSHCACVAQGMLEDEDFLDGIVEVLESIASSAGFEDGFYIADNF